VPAETEMTTSELPPPRCWCCDGEFTEVSLVRLGARPEVTICLDSARFLNRRALARRHAQPTASVAARGSASPATRQFHPHDRPPPRRTPSTDSTPD
jgi:hypothetical protein